MERKNARAGVFLSAVGTAIPVIEKKDMRKAGFSS